MADSNNANNVLEDYEHMLAENIAISGFEPNNASNNFLMCEQHAEILNLFCTNCVVGVCYRCIIEKHNGHPLNYYDEAIARGLAVRNALSWEMQDAINDLTVAKSRATQIQASLRHKMKAARNDIKIFFESCHTALAKREQDLLRRLGLAHCEKQFLLNQQVDQFKDCIGSLVKSYEKLHEKFPFGDPVEQAVVNSEALRDLLTSRDVDLTPASTDRIRFWKDFAQRMRIRHFLGSIETGETLILDPDEDTGYDSPDPLD